MHRLTIVLILTSAFSLSLSGQSTPVQLTYERSGVQWSAIESPTGMVLTVSGPEGFSFKQEYGANARPAFSVSDEQGLRRAEGTYLWELVVQLPTGEPQVLSGSFAIRAGRIIPFPENEYPVAVSEEAPANSLNIDREGRLGVGTTVPGAQLHVKGPEPGVTLEDTSLGGREYTLRSLERGDGSLGLFDEASGQARWLVDSEGRVGINTTQPTSTLTVDGYIESTKGFLVNGRPLRFGTLGGGAVPLITEGDSNNFFGTGAGYSNTTGWSNAFFGSAAGYGNTTGYGNSFFGHQAGRFNTTAGGNSFFGESSGYSNTTGNSNSFFGSGTGFSNSTGSSNSFFGSAAGRENTTGTANSFYGMAAGYYNTTGYDNSFFGGAAGNRNTTGISNSFFGRLAGYFNTTGSGNSFLGHSAGLSNTTGSYNTFFGTQAGYSNTEGLYNAFFGIQAGLSNTTGGANSFFGSGAGIFNTSGPSNSFFGSGAGDSNTVEAGNTFIGYSANFNPGADPATNPVTNATAIGSRSWVSQSNSLVLGSIAGLNGASSNVNVGIGTPAPGRQLHLAGPNAVFRMDRTMDTASFLLVRISPAGAILKSFIVGTNASAVNQGEFIINDMGAAVGGAGARRMTINNAGNVQFTGTVTAADFIQSSSLALKSNVRTLENALDMVNRLRGVRFDWKASGKGAVGLIAEEVDQVLPEVVGYNDDGSAPAGVNYANLVAVLVEAVKEQQKTIEGQQQTIEQQEKNALSALAAQQVSIARQQEELNRLKAELEMLKGLLRQR